MALLFSPILVVFILIKLFFGNRQRYREVVFFFLLSFGLSAFFWLPALLEKHYVLLSTVPIADRNIYFVKLSQLLIPRWGYGLPDHPDGFSYQIGLPQIVVYLISVFISLAFYIQKRKKNTEGFVHYAALFSASILICILLLFPFTAFIWKITPLLKEINYPWTLLGPTGFLISLLAGFLWTRSQPIQYIVIGLCVITILLVLPHAVPQSYFDKGDAFYLTNDATTTSSQELTPLWVKQKPNHRAEKKVEIVNGKGMIENIFSNSRIFSFTVNLQSKSLIRINIIYYPGWVMNIDGLHSRFTYNNMYGVMDVVVDEGKHTVRGEFVETPDRLLSNFITIGSMITLFVIILVSSLQTRSAKKFGL